MLFFVLFAGLVLIVLYAASPGIAALALFVGAGGFALGYVAGWNGLADKLHTEDIEKAGKTYEARKR